MNHRYTLRHALYLFFFLCFLCFLIFVGFYKPTLDLGKYSLEHLPDFSFEDVEISQLVDGELKWQLQSSYAEIMKKDNYATLKDSHGKIYDNKKEIIRFDSMSAKVSLKDSTMSLDYAKAQFLMYDDRVELYADILIWNPKRKQFVGHNNIILKSALAVLYGDYFYVDVPFKLLKVNKNSRAEVYTSDVEKD